MEFKHYIKPDYSSAKGLLIYKKPDVAQSGFTETGIREGLSSYNYNFDKEIDKTEPTQSTTNPTKTDKHNFSTNEGYESLGKGQTVNMVRRSW